MNSRNQWLIVMFSGTLVLFLLLSLFYRYHINFFIRNFEYLMNYSIGQNIIKVTFLFLIVQIPFYLGIMPGYSLFCLLLAYILQNIQKTFLILTFNAMILLILSFCFYKKIMDYLGKEENDLQVEQLRQKFKQKKQLNTNLIQFMIYPSFFKTIALVYLECDFQTFYIHGLFW